MFNLDQEKNRISLFFIESPDFPLSGVGRSVTETNIRDLKMLAQSVTVWAVQVLLLSLVLIFSNVRHYPT